MEFRRLVAAVATLLVASAMLVAVPSGPPAAAAGAPQVRQVPADYPTIQAAVDAAADGDVVLLAPGTYVGSVFVTGKSVTIASYLLTTGDPSYVDQTILDGDNGTDIVSFGPDIVGMSRVVGVTARNATNGISGSSPYSVYSSHITDTSDAIDFEYGAFGGIVRGNLIDLNSDDAVDYDGTSWGVVEHNVLVDNDDDGIEIRYPHLIEANPPEYVIRHNVIARNGEDGLQMIESDSGPSNRRTVVEGNLFEDNVEAAFSMLCCSQTTENLAGAPLAEPFLVHDNTFRNNGHGVIGGDAVVAVNNVFEGHDVAIKRLQGSSVAAHNLFWGNTQDLVDVIGDPGTDVTADPLLATDGSLGPGSPAVDAGVAQYVHDGATVLDLASTEYAGAAPDLGAFEVGGTDPLNLPPFVGAGLDQDLGDATVAQLAGVTSDDGVPGTPLAISWSDADATGNVSFSDPTALDPTATFAAPGVYRLRLAVSDGMFTTTSIVVVRTGVDAPLDPTLRFAGLIETSPFVGSSVSVRDNEGSAYVPADDSLWIISDNDGAAFEIDLATGALRQVVGQSDFAAAPRFGVGDPAGPDRDEDFESMAYDAANDALYAFSGASNSAPTAFRLLRDASGTFRVDSWQPLGPTDDFTAAGWRPTDGTLYVARDDTIFPYDYETNTVGTGFGISGLSRPFGIDFDDDGDLVAVTHSERLLRADFDAREVRPAWNFDLTPFDIRDSRGVAVIGDQLFVSDGYDQRLDGDPKDHAVFVLDVAYGSDPVAPTASFTTSTTSGSAPLTVNFTNTSSGTAGTRLWDFGDGTTATVADPTHVFTEPGDFTVTLTVTNEAGSDSASTVISVTAPTATTIVTPSADSYVNGSKPTKNYGDAAYLKLLSSNPDYHPYVQFPVSGLNAPPQSATLRLYVTDGSADGGTWYPVSEPWSESTITWANAPALSGPPIATIGRVDSGGWVEIDVTDEVTGNGVYSFAATSASTNTARFASRESAFPPELVVQAAPTPVAPTAGFTPSVTSGEAPLVVDFADTSTGAPQSWAWDFGDGTTSTEQHPTHTFTAAGTYTVALTATNALGTDTATATITVDPPPPPVAPTASFTATPTAGTAPLSVDLTDTSTGAPESWSWDFGDGTTSTEQHPTHVFGSGGTYVVELTVANAIGSSSTSLAIVVDEPPAVSTFPATADSYVSASSASKNYGDYSDLKLLGPKNQYEYRPYFAFQVSGLAGAPTQAVLRVHVTDGGPSGGTWHEVGGLWDEASITWDNAPGLTGLPLGTVGVVTAGDWIEIDVTARIAGDGTYSFAATSLETNTVKLSSRETAFAAELVVTR